MDPKKSKLNFLPDWLIQNYKKINASGYFVISQGQLFYMYFTLSCKNRKILLTFISALLFISLIASCKSNKYSCDANRSRSYSKMKKNKSNYGVLYEHKSKPVPKNYLIKNSR